MSLSKKGTTRFLVRQARALEGSTLLSTSTRNFPGRMGDNTNVYLCSAELCAVGATLGRIPTVKEYQEAVQELNLVAADLYRYMNFDKMESYNK